MLGAFLFFAYFCLPLKMAKKPKLKHMKNLIFVFSSISVLFLSSCGPAAENREAMYARSKVFQDSIANVLKTSMDAAAAPAPGMAPPAVITSTTQDPAAPSGTTK